MLAARGIVAERASVLSHTAITGREFVIATIVGVLVPEDAPLYDRLAGF